MTDFTSVKIKQETDESIENIGDWKEVELSSDIKDEETNRFEFEEDIIDAFEHEGDNEKFQKEAIKENLENVSEQDPLRDVLRNEKYDRNKSKVCKICSATFTRPVNLKRHIESVHEGKKPRARAKKAQRLKWTLQRICLAEALMEMVIMKWTTLCSICSIQ